MDFLIIMKRRLFFTKNNRKNCLKMVINRYFVSTSNKASGAGFQIYILILTHARILRIGLKFWSHFYFALLWLLKDNYLFKHFPSAIKFFTTYSRFFFMTPRIKGITVAYFFSNTQASFFKAKQEFVLQILNQ